jgi:hypothetical protein
VTDVKNDRVVATGEVFRHVARGVLKRHFPATKRDDFRAEFDVQVIKIGTAIQQNSLGGSTVHTTQVVLTKELVKVSLVHDEQRNLGIEITESPYLGVLLRRQALFEDRQFDEETPLGQKEVRSKAANGSSLFVPVQRELQGLVDPRESVEGEKLREESFAWMGEGLRNAGYHARMATTRVVAP